MLGASRPEPLAGPVRRALEPRFGADLGGVRVHTGPEAHASSRVLDARAWTSGRDIAFGEREFAPETRSGMRLLVHELSHVLQQRDHAGPAAHWRVSRPHEASEQAADRAADTVLSGGRAHVAPVSAGGGVRVIARQPRGTAVKRDRISVSPHKVQEPGRELGEIMETWKGDVGRYTYRNEAEARRADAGEAVRPLHYGEMHVQWDPEACEVVVPIKVRARGAVPDDLKYVQPGVKKEETTDPVYVDDVAESFVADIGTYLSGWFTAEWSGCGEGPAPRCVGKAMPIRVAFTRVKSDPDYEIAVSHLPGRSYVRNMVYTGTGLVVLQQSDTWTGRHEASHLALVAGDEYHETAAGVLARNPDAGAPERVFDNDWSLLNDQDAFGRFSQLHERHFSFATAFLDAIARKNHWSCRATLRRLPRSVPLDWRVGGFAGYTTFGGGGIAYGGGFGIGLPANRRRELNYLISANAGLLLSADEGRRTAFFAGLRFGIERAWTPSGGGLALGAYGEAGVLSEWGSTQRPGATDPFVGVGGTVGYGFAPFDPAGVTLGLDVAATLRVDSPLETWFRAGAFAGFRF